MTDIEPVEIKVTVASTASGAGAVSDAIAALSLGVPDGHRAIWFLEDCTPGLPTALPLLDAGVVLRLRQEAGGEDDSTVKLRPCRRSQLAPKWQTPDKGPGWKYRIEEDWAGTNQTLAASCLSNLVDGRLAAAIEGTAGWDSVFHSKQQDYLVDCSDLRVNLGGLVALGPISADKWDGLTIVEQEVAAERWTVGELDFLELSIREDDGREKAVGTQKRFIAALRDRGMPVLEGQTKTRTVLEHLASARLEGRDQRGG